MFILFLFLIVTAPLISSAAFPVAQGIHAFLLLAYLLCAILLQRPLQRPKLAFAGAAFLFSSLLSCLRPQADQNTALAIAANAANGILCFWYVSSLDKTRTKKVLIALFVSLLAVVLLAWYQLFFGFTHLLGYLAKGGNTNTYALDQIATLRVFIPFVTPNALAGYLAMLVPLCFLRRSSRWLGLAAGCTLLLTQSIGAIFSLTVACILTLYMTKNMREQALKLILAFLVLLCAAVALRFAFSNAAHQPGFSVGQRLVYWQETLQQIARTPWFGNGTASNVLKTSQFAHNSYLQLWAEKGIIGLAAFVWFITALLRQLLMAGKLPWPLLASVGVFLIHNFIDFTFSLPEVSLIWWVVAGLAATPCGICAQQVFLQLRLKPDPPQSPGL